MSVSKEKFVRPRSFFLTTQPRDFIALGSNIFAKTKKIAEPFLPVHIEPRSKIA